MDNKRSLTDEQVHEICELLMNGERIKDIVDQYNVSSVVISSIKYKRSYRDITSLYNLEETWKSRNIHARRYSYEFIDFIIECIKNNISSDEILSDERCEINDKDKLLIYISRIRTGRMYRNRLIKNKMYHDNINNPINNVVISNEAVINIANDIKENPGSHIKELSEKYDIKPMVISRIRTGRTFTNITNIEQTPTLRVFASTDTIINIANDIKENPSVSNIELAKKYNIKKCTISNIRNGKIHSDITGIKEGQYRIYLSKNEIINIANDIKENPNISNKELYEKYNLSYATISNIRNGKIHSDITGIKKGQYNLYKNKETK